MKTHRLQLTAAFLVFFAINTSAAVVRYVDLNCTNPVSPYTSWATAATNIQNAVDASAPGDFIWVTNGVYQNGGKLVPAVSTMNRVAVDRPLTVASVNGPGLTVIQAGGTARSPVRCAYLTNGAALAGFTLTSGSVNDGQKPGSGAGGGVYCQSALAVLMNCIITGNSASSGGGVYQGTLQGCFLNGNSAGFGGGAYQATLNNCTLTGNSASSSGGGSYNSVLNNCIAYYNNAPAGSNCSGSVLNFCCTTPLPGAGMGNFATDPQLAGSSHLSAVSPCRGAGNAAYASGTDIDGETWASPPAVGCDEYWPDNVNGPISVSITATYTNVAIGYAVGLAGAIAGKVSASAWDFGDSTVLSNQLYASHAWTNGGDFPVVLTAYNQDNPGGISATATVHVVGQPIHYVSLDSTNPVPPFTSWDTAATNIQSAVEAATAPGESVLVSNGVYFVGSRYAGTTTTNRVAILQQIRVSSVNGPLVTAIQGQRASAGGGLGSDAVRCVYLTNGAVLDGFTLTNGATTSFDYGGGVYCQTASSTVTNCIISANYAYNGAGAYNGNFNNCTFQGNSAYSSGGACYLSTLNLCTLYDNGANNNAGGAVNSTLNLCTLSHNSAINYGGGMASSTLNSCILEGNTAEYGGGSYYGTANNCLYTNNYGYSYGGGIYYGTVNNCLMIGNGAGDAVYTSTGGGAAYYGTLNSCRIVNNYGSWNGGGTYNSTVNNCILTGNSTLYGGGANGGTLRNCTVTGNSGLFGGGGVQQCTLYNSIVHYNTQAGGTNNYAGASTFSYCCTTPDPGSGSGNITNEPVFANAAAGDLHLQSNSPCINSGNNAAVTAGSDLDGNPRISGGTVDIGAYEYQTPVSKISYAWLQQYGLPITTNIDTADLDGTGFNVYQDWIAGLNPTNALSVLAMLPPAPTNNPAGLVVSWQSVSNITYFLQSSTNLGTQPAFSTIQSNLVGRDGTTSYTDTTATNSGPYFYRVGVQQ
jgi:hypothetical protein